MSARAFAQHWPLEEHPCASGWLARPGTEVQACLEWGLEVATQGNEWVCATAQLSASGETGVAHVVPRRIAREQGEGGVMATRPCQALASR